MKKSIKAILSVVLVLVLGATMLVACNKDKDEARTIASSK